MISFLPFEILKRKPTSLCCRDSCPSIVRQRLCLTLLFVTPVTQSVLFFVHSNIWCCKCTYNFFYLHCIFLYVNFNSLHVQYKINVNVCVFTDDQSFLDFFPGGFMKIHSVVCETNC